MFVDWRNYAILWFILIVLWDLTRKRIQHIKNIMVGLFCLVLYGPRNEKTCLLEFANNTGTDQPAHSAHSDQRLCYSHFRKYHI